MSLVSVRLARHMAHAAPAVLALFMLSSQASAQATIDDVLKRLEALEKENGKLRTELKRIENKTTEKATQAKAAADKALAAAAQAAEMVPTAATGTMVPTAGQGYVVAPSEPDGWY